MFLAVQSELSDVRSELLSVVCQVHESCQLASHFAVDQAFVEYLFDLSGCSSVIDSFFASLEHRLVVFVAEVAGTGPGVPHAGAVLADRAELAADVVDLREVSRLCRSVCRDT